MASWSVEEAQAIIDRRRDLDGATLPILHDLQAAFGFVPQEAVPMIAEALNLSRAEVHGVVSFYHDFRSAPAGRRTAKLCRGEACQAMGGAALAEDLLQRLAIDWGDTTADGALTVDAVYCLGLCAVAPSALIDGAPVGRLTRDRLAAAVEEGR